MLVIFGGVREGCYRNKILCTNYEDHILLLANRPAQGESLLHCQKQAAGGIDLHENANKMEYLRFKRERASEISWQVRVL